MQHLRLLVLVITFQLVICDIGAANGPKWIRNFEEGQKTAISEQKDLFILFTGHGWCHSCIVLDEAVFQKQEFVETMSKHYVFVELDFNIDDTVKDQERKTKLQQLQAHYLIPAVPTAVLAGCDGIPYAFITGYNAKAGLAGYLKQMEIARKANAKQNALLATAATKSGKVRAKFLSDALDCIVSGMGDIDERGDDPLLHFYGNSVQEILDLTDSSGSIADKYISLHNSRAEWIASNAVFAKLKTFRSTEDYAGAIKYIEKHIKTTSDAAVRLRLEETRQTYLEWDDQFEEALATCRRLLALEDLPADARKSLLDREAYNLFRLNRFDEGLAHFDRRIREAADDEEQRLQLLSWKVQLTLRRAPVEKSIAACEMYRSATKRGTEDWINATFLLALELQRADRHLQALNLTNEILQVDRSSPQLLWAAESYIALERYTEAVAVIEEARSQNRSLKDSPRKSDRDDYLSVVTRINKLTKKIPQKTQTK